MLLNTIFFALITNSAIGGRDVESDRIHFGRREIVKSNGIRRNEFRRMWPFKSQETTITFVEDSYRNETNKWTTRPYYNSNTNLFESSLNRRNNTSNQNSGSGHFAGNSNSNQEWESNWQPSSSMNGKEKMQEKDSILWGSGNFNKKNTSNSNGNMSSNDRIKSGSKNASKRKLLPEDSCGIDLPRRILGGTAADIDEYPWLALLQYRDRNGKISHDCGGVLISSRYVITAAHCTIGIGVTTRKLNLEKVRLGEWDLKTDSDCQQEVCSDPLQDIAIEEIINHPNYNPRQTSQTHDIALIRLRRKANFNQFVQPICLPLDDVADMNFEGQKLTVAGWGKTSNAKNSASNVKMKVDIPVVTWDSCRSFYESFYSDVKIAKTQMCAGGEEGRDSCQGDSGGPLMSNEQVQHDFRWFVIGIVSSGPAACGVEGRPSLYTKVSEYSDWVLSNMKE